MDLPLTADTRTLARPKPEIPESSQQLAQKRRFDRAARLFSEAGLARLQASRVLVIGVGGVGSYAAEALARSGVGHLVLIDFDKVCITNTNRQLHTMKGTLGKLKVEIMAERLRLISPAATVETRAEFYGPETSDRLLEGPIDFVIDAIDNFTAKAFLLATCLDRKLPLVCSMGAGARLDPTQVRVADLSETTRDPFASAFRKLLRKKYAIDPRKGHPIGVPAVYSLEDPREPAPLSYEAESGFKCVCPGGTNGLNDCDHRNRIDGSASFVTGSFGHAAASVAVRSLIALAEPITTGADSLTPGAAP